MLSLGGAPCSLSTQRGARYVQIDALSNIDRDGRARRAQETTPRAFSLSPRPTLFLPFKNGHPLNLLKIDTDHDGHGTFVAGVAAGKTYGVCKSCNVHSVKVRVHCMCLLCVVHSDTVSQEEEEGDISTILVIMYVLVPRIARRNAR